MVGSHKQLNLLFGSGRYCSEITETQLAPEKIHVATNVSSPRQLEDVCQKESSRICGSFKYLYLKWGMITRSC